ncbi:hypothetical protein K445DRAFT_26357 [Daldinia sp. EC12]|nr:hypothetical protein K445DRAFT_26357 [Daldinia sp. EC12]
MTPSQRSPVPSSRPPLTQDGIKIIIICSVFTLLSIFFVALRLWARKVTRQELVFHDWAIVAALFFTCSFSAMTLYFAVACGAGYHTEDLLAKWPAVVPRLYKTFFAAESLWIAATSLVKLSILHFYVRIFPDKRFQVLCYVVMGVITAGALSLFIRMFFLCTPLEAAWNPDIFVTDPTAHCVNLQGAALSNPIINTIFDITVFLLPMPQIWKLQLGWKKKLMIIGIFALGFLIWAVIKLSITDLPYTVLEDSIWVTLEPCLGIINACLPLLRPLGPKFSSVLGWSTFSSKTRSRKWSSGTYLNRPRSKGGNHHMCTPLHEVSISTTEPWTRQETATNYENEGDILPQTQYGGRTSGCISERESNSIRVTVEWEVQREVSEGKMPVA